MFSNFTNHVFRSFIVCPLVAHVIHQNIHAQIISANIANHLIVMKSEQRIKGKFNKSKIEQKILWETLKRRSAENEVHTNKPLSP